MSDDSSEFIDCSLNGKSKWTPNNQEEALCFEIHNWINKTWALSNIPDEAERKKQMLYALGIVKMYIGNLEEILK